MEMLMTRTKRRNKIAFFTSLLAILLFSSFKIVDKKHGAIIDQAKLKIEYRFEMKKKPYGGVSVMNDTALLLYGDRYSLSYYQSTYYADSLTNKPGGKKVKFRMLERGLNEKDPYLFLEPHTLPDYTYLDHQQNRIINFDSEKLYVPILYEEPIEEISWSLQGEDTKVIAGYQTSKATCSFRGRSYTAWYTPEIPIEVGPWKFQGLPGAILEVYDDDRCFFWSAFSVEYSPKKPIEPIRWIKFSALPFTEVERKEYLRDARSYMNGESVDTNKTLQKVIATGARTHYLQRKKQKSEYDFIERDYLSGHQDETDSTIASPNKNYSLDSFTIEGVPRKDYLLLQYEYASLKDTVDIIYYRPDLQLVEISNDQSVTYSLRTYQMKEEFGSEAGKKRWQQLFNQGLESVKAGALPMTEFMNRLPRLGDQEVITLNLQTGAMIVYDNIGTEQYQYNDSATIEWELLDQHKSLLGYDCQLAKAHFRGRNWYAWYSMDIPVSAGPWKLFGLPGLIFEAYDEKEHYHYTLKGVEQKKPSLDYSILISPNATPIDRKKLISRQQVFRATGGEEFISVASSTIDNYPKPKELE